MLRPVLARAYTLLLLSLVSCKGSNTVADRDSAPPTERDERDGGKKPDSPSDSGSSSGTEDSGKQAEPDASRDAAPGPTGDTDASTRTDAAADASVSPPTDADGDRGPDGLLLTAVTSGRGYSCGLTTTGKVFCWGDGSYGSLGTGAYSDTQFAPDAVKATGFPGVTKRLVAGGFNTCAIDDKKVLRCCGHTTGGLLPTGSANSTVLGPPGPIQIPAAPPQIRSVALGFDRNGIFIDELDGSASYWNGTGMLTKLENLSGLKDVSTGGEHWCGLTNDSGVKCWGRTAFGVLGDGQDHLNEPNVSSPMDVVGLSSGIKVLSNGFNHVCVLTESRGVKCWGTKGVLGTGSDANSNVPVDVPGLTSNVLALSTSYRHTCALTESDLVCWGWSFNMQLGTTTGANSAGTVDVPTAVPGIQANEVLAISTGYSHTCVSLKRGGAKCWGQNHILGVAAGNTATPTKIKGL